MEKLNRFTFYSLLLLGFSAACTPPALAKTNTVTLDVPGMNCAVCPITVRKALEKVPGVSRVNVTYETREAAVTFDEAKTDIKTLENATFEAGYKSRLKTGQ